LINRAENLGTARLTTARANRIALPDLGARLHDLLTPTAPRAVNGHHQLAIQAQAEGRLDLLLCRGEEFRHGTAVSQRNLARGGIGLVAQAVFTKRQARAVK